MNAITSFSDFLWTYVLVTALLVAAVVFTVWTRGVQIRLLPNMIKLLFRSSKSDELDHGRPETQRQRYKTVSSFQAFTLSIAGRVGTGNIAGVAIAIAIGGPGSVFWMWLIALLGTATAFVESTLGQLFKVRGEDSFRGGPAYYILKGMHSRWFAVLFAIIITLTFGLAFTTVQSNTFTLAAQNSFGWSPIWVAIGLTVAVAVVIWGGVQSISKFSEIVVPIMAVAYILLAAYVILINFTQIPHVFYTIVHCAFNGDAAIGATVGGALMLGVKRGLFSNEAGEGSAPNVAATASVSHPVKQGLIQALGVYTDTFLVCTATAFIILWSGLYNDGVSGIVLTQNALNSEVGAVGQYFVTIAIFMFAYTTIIANYYYGETNIKFIKDSRRLTLCYKVVFIVVMFIGCIATLETVWTWADIFMAFQTLINLTALAFLSRYAIRCLKDYTRQLREGRNPVYYRDTIPEIAPDTDCWPDQRVISD